MTLTLNDLCVLCHHPVGSHDPGPDGVRPCRQPGHPDGVPCADCRALLSDEYRNRVLAEQDSEEFEKAWSAFCVTYADAEHSFGAASRAHWSAIHQAALASALIAVREAHSTGVMPEEDSTCA